ncbi:MAG: biotin--[acetyl-CoA-carboxylase] ligase [Balneolaceae bacterium]
MPSAFNAELFQNQLNTTWLGSEFLYKERVDSTNTCLKKVPSPELVHGTVLIADHQTKGRGQYEKKWNSEPGENLTFSIALRPPAPERLTLLTLSCANAITMVLEELVNREVRIKWPNDIYIEGKKIGGLLTECCFNGKNLDRVLIGIGLNIGQTYFEGDLLHKATSVAGLTGKQYSREEILCNLLTAIESFYMKWHKFDDELQKEISRKMIGYGEWVSLQINKILQPEKYKFLGVNRQGELIVLDEQLDINTFSYEQIRIITHRKGVSETESE